MTYIPFPDKKYKVILCDPPWSYNDKALAGKRGAGCKYEVQDLEWIKNLPVKDIADDDCALFLWVTMPQLPVVWEVLKSWGFKYKSNAFTWIKKNKKADSLFWGMGTGTRANAELCLLATKGKPKRVSASVHSVIMSPIQKHSQKPDEARKRIIELYGDVPRIELFARDASTGFDRWGLEAPETEVESVTEESSVVEETVKESLDIEKVLIAKPRTPGFIKLDHNAVFGPGRDNYGRDNPKAIRELIDKIGEKHRKRKEESQNAEVVPVDEFVVLDGMTDSDSGLPVEVQHNSDGTFNLKTGNVITKGCYITGYAGGEWSTEDDGSAVCTYTATWHGDINKEREAPNETN